MKIDYHFTQNLTKNQIEKINEIHHLREQSPITSWVLGDAKDHLVVGQSVQIVEDLLKEKMPIAITSLEVEEPEALREAIQALPTPVKDAFKKALKSAKRISLA